MIGEVNANKEATLSLRLLGANGQELEIKTVIDTGFNGFLTLPQQLIEQLGYPYISRGYVILADGRLQEIDIYEAQIKWDSMLISVETDVAETEPLIGMALFYGYELNIQTVDGGIVTLTKM